MYLLTTTVIKVFSLISVLALGGGISYYYYHSSNDFIDVEQLPAIEEEHDYYCVHDEFMKTMDLVVPEQQESPIDATLAHEKKKQGINTKSVNAKYKKFIQKKLVPAAISFLEDAYRVYPKAIIDEIIGRQRCGDYSIPKHQGKNGVSGYNLVLYIGAQEDEGNLFWKNYLLNRKSLVRKSGCLYIGQIDIQTGSWVDFKNPTNTAWFKWIQTTIHEITHVLGFSKWLFPFYVNPTNNQRLGVSAMSTVSQGRNWITLPDVVRRFKEHYNCQSAFGAPLENNGGSYTSGSHWERTTFGNEGMTGSEFSDSVFTQFTFALLEGSGWYLSNFQVAEPFVWGKDEGCGIAEGGYPSTDGEFCQRGAWGCSVDYMGFGSCNFHDFLAPGCGYWRGFCNTDCRVRTPFTDVVTRYTGGNVGGASRCWNTTLTQEVGFREVKTSCYNSQCITNGQAILVSIGSQNYTCTQDNQVLNVNYEEYSGTVTCPTIWRFCAYENMCPNSCSGVGTCRNNVCDCWAGFGGSDCSEQTGR